MLINVNFIISVYPTEKSYNIVKKSNLKLADILKIEGIICYFYLKPTVKTSDRCNLTSPC